MTPSTLSPFIWNLRVSFYYRYIKTYFLEKINILMQKPFKIHSSSLFCNKIVKFHWVYQRDGLDRIISITKYGFYVSITRDASYHDLLNFLLWSLFESGNYLFGMHSISEPWHHESSYFLYGRLYYGRLDEPLANSNSIKWLVKSAASF